MKAKPVSGYQPLQRQRKSMFPFQYGMRSQEFKGVGANRAENVWFEDGRLKKMPGTEEFKDLSVSEIVLLDEFQKTDGTYQAIVAYPSGAVWKFRAIEEDGTVVTPATQTTGTLTGTSDTTNGSVNITGTGTAYTTELEPGDFVSFSPGDGEVYEVDFITSDTALNLKTAYAGADNTGTTVTWYKDWLGLGDIDFTNGQFSFEQVGRYGFVAVNTPGENSIWRWTGNSLAVVQNGAPTGVLGLARDGKRLAAITVDGTEFSSSGLSTSWNTGTGVNISGEYSTSIIGPRAILTAGVGVIIIGETGSEAHKVVPNNASDDVSADTKVDQYNDNEIGVTLQKQATMGKSFFWRVTTDGILRTNPFNGETVNITDIGKARRYFETWDVSDSAIAYDEKNQQVVCAVKEGAQNDILVALDVTQEDIPMSIKSGQYYKVLNTIQNQLYGGGSREGIIDTLFTGLTTRDAGSQTFRYITEWDEMTNQLYWKNFKRAVICANLSPNSSMTVKLYFNGDTNPVYTEMFTTTDTTTAALTDAAYGEYVFRGSLATADKQNSDEIGESRKTKRYSTMCLEITENSGEPFEVHDIILEYKTKNKFYHQLTRKNTLFA